MIEVMRCRFFVAIPARVLMLDTAVRTASRWSSPRTSRAHASLGALMEDVTAGLGRIDDATTH